MAEQKSNPLAGWFPDGPTLAYSRRYRLVCWGINLGLYALLNMFYLRLQTGVWFSWRSPHGSPFLIEQLLAPLSVFNYPIQIVVLGAIMGLLCAVPILTAQLHHVLYALPLVAAVLLLGQNRLLSLSLLLSCAAAGFQPLRFKSKFVAAVLCLLPPVLYWGIFSGRNPEQDILRQAVLYAPWVLAFLLAVAFFGVVLALGHFVRYRPGILTPVSGLFLAGVVLLFHLTVGMDERDFQANVYRYRPEAVPAVQSESIGPLVERETAGRLEGRADLNPQAVRNLVLLAWQEAFAPGRLDETAGGADQANEGSAWQVRREVQQARTTALALMAGFSARYPQDARVADTLYYEGRWLDLRADARALRDEEVLRFYDDEPGGGSQGSWEELRRRFPQSPVAVEARWRWAKRLAAQQPRDGGETFKFDAALQELTAAQERCQSLRAEARKQGGNGHGLARLDSLFGRPPPPLGAAELAGLWERIGRLQTLIGKENRTGHILHEQRLAEFVALDPRQLGYQEKLSALKREAPQPDPLLDNIEWAEAMLEADVDRRVDRLTDVAQRYADRDGGVAARVSLAEVLLEKYRRSEHNSDRDVLRSRGLELLQQVIGARPESFFAQKARELLANWPVPN